MTWWQWGLIAYGIGLTLVCLFFYGAFKNSRHLDEVIRQMREEQDISELFVCSKCDGTNLATVNNVKHCLRCYYSFQ